MTSKYGDGFASAHQQLEALATEVKRLEADVERLRHELAQQREGRIVAEVRASALEAECSLHRDLLLEATKRLKDLVKP